MSHKRLTSLRSSRTSSQRRNAEQRTRRSVRLFERLEDRNLLSGDALAFHNAFWPADVDNNLKVAPQDALYVINALNNGGSRQLGPTSAAAAASGEAGTTGSTTAASGYVDVNGDGNLTPIDVLRVINVLNGGEGESKPTDVVRYSLTVTDTSNVALPTNADGSYAITKGQTFRLHGILQDARNVLGGTSTGVFAAYMNIVAGNSNLISLRYGETQQLLFVPTTHPDTSVPPVQVNDTITGTFTLTFQGQTTQPINTQATINPDTGDVVKSRVQLIQDALVALPNIGVGNVEVTKSLTNDNAFNIRFTNALGEQDLPVMVGDYTSLIHLQSGSVADNFYPASLNNPGTFASSFAHVTPYVNGPSPSADLPVPAPGGSPLAEVGSFLDGFSVASPGGKKEFFTVDIQAQLPGEVAFSGALPSTPTGHETLVFPSPGGGTAKFTVDPQYIGFVQDSVTPLRLKITAPVVAGTSQFTVAEDSVSTLLNVLANSLVNVPAGGVGVPVLASVGPLSDPGAGTISFTTGATGQVNFTPASNYNGTVTFTYIVNDQAPTPHADTGTATLTVTPINDPPTLSAIANLTIDEDAAQQTVNLAGITAGPGETQQPLNVTASSSNPVLTGLITVNYTSPNGVGTVQFTPTADANGTAIVTVTVTDGGLDNNLETTADNGTSQQPFTVTARAINDPPVNLVPGTQVMAPGADLTLSKTIGNGISVSDPQDVPWIAAQDVIVHVTLAADVGSADKGTLTLLQPGTLTVTGNGSNTITIQGLTKDINIALDAGVTYSNAIVGAHSLTVTTSDLGNVDWRPAAPILTDTDTIVIAPPTKPYAVNDTIGVLEDTAGNTLNVLANDLNHLFQSGGAGLNITVVTSPSLHGGAVVNNGNNVTYTPAANFFGADEFTYTIVDTVNAGDGPSTAKVTVNVTGVNDAPSFTKGADNVTVVEDSVAYGPTTWATNLDPGPGETQQLLSFTATNDKNELFAVQPAIATDGKLSFTPAPNANGSATVTVWLHDNGGTANGGVDTSDPQTFTITITAVNDAPSFTKGADVTVLEDSGLYGPTAWATGISAGPADEAGQALDFIVSNNNNGLFSVQPAVTSGGMLSFTPARDANGTATVTVWLHDNGGGTADGGVDTSAPQTVTITVTAVNDAPSFTAMDPPAVNEDASPQSIANWATFIPGPANESTQQVKQYTVGAVSNTALFASIPAVSNAGTLTYTTVLNASGISTFTVTVQDDGGTANGDVDTSPAQTFTLTVNAVNDAPTIAAPTDASTGQNSPVTFSGATAISVADLDALNGQEQVTLTATNGTVTVGGNSGATLPFTGTLTQLNSTLASVTFTPAQDFTGTATLAIHVNDRGNTGDGPVEGLSADRAITIAVAAVNKSPIANPDEVGTPENTPKTFSVFADNGHGADSPGVNESDQNIHVLSWNAAGVKGTVELLDAATGSFRYTPPDPYYNSLVDGPQKFTYTIQDNGQSWINNIMVDDFKTATATVTISVTEVNQAPTAVDDLHTISTNPAPGQSFTFNASELTKNDSSGPANESGQTLTVTAVGSPTTKGTVTVDNKGTPNDPSDDTITYTLPAIGFDHLDTFTYTVTDNGTTNGILEQRNSTATVTIRDVIPKKVSGFVYVDRDGDGARDVDGAQENQEWGIAMVEVWLTGTDIGGKDVNLKTVTGPDGSYQFSDLLPSKEGTNYTVTEIQPRDFYDGQETLGDQGGSITANTNDQFSIPGPLLDYDNNAQGVGNNFGELGLTSAYVSLPLRGLLASERGPNSILATGLVFGTDLNGNVKWYINLGGWDDYVPGAKTAAGGYQVTYNNNGTPSDPSDDFLPFTDIHNGSVTARMPYDQVHVRSAGGANERVTQIIGAAKDFGLPSYSQVAGEGEGGVVVEDQQLQLLAEAGAGTQYSQAVDAIFGDSVNPLV